MDHKVPKTIPFCGDTDTRMHVLDGVEVVSSGDIRKIATSSMTYSRTPRTQLRARPHMGCASEFTWHPGVPVGETKKAFPHLDNKPHDGYIRARAPMQESGAFANSLNP